MDLKLILMLAAEKGVPKIQFFGDSLVVINQIWGVFSLENFLLRPIIKEIQNTSPSFIHIYFHHVYREQNELADGLSKAVFLLDAGQWCIWESEDGQSSEYDHIPFS